MKDLPMTDTPAPRTPAPASVANPSHPQHSGQRKAQRGISLFIVIVIVLLSTLLALWSSRTALFNEMVVGNDADYQRAFEAAQALLQDAELDIRDERSDGKPCKQDRPSGAEDTVCRQGSVDKIPLEEQEVGPLLAELDNQPTKCRHALCTKRLGRQDFWNYSGEGTAPANLKAGEISLKALAVDGIGARYGQYTGAATGSNSNPILSDDSAADKGGWYWIEVLPHDESTTNFGLIVSDTPADDRQILPLILLPNVVYRITALAYGRKPSTMVVLQQTYAQQTTKN